MCLKYTLHPPLCQYSKLYIMLIKLGGIKMGTATKKVTVPILKIAGPVSRVLSIPPFIQIVSYQNKFWDEAIIYLERGLLRALKRPYPTGHPMCTDRSEQLLVPALFGLAPRRDWSSHPCTECYRARLCPLIPGQRPGMVGLFIEKPRPILIFRWTAVSRYAALRSSDFPPPE